MAAIRDFEFYRGENAVIIAQMEPVEDITGWSLLFTVRQQLDLLPIVLTKATGGSGITILNGPGGIFQINIATVDTNTLNVGDYLYDIQRTDFGFVTVLTIGKLTLLHPVRNIP